MPPDAPAGGSAGNRRQIYRVFGSYRFLLALLVLTSHASMWLGRGVGPLALGNVGVMSFFVLSGFVIAGALDVFYRDSVARFAVNRFLKLYPTYWVAAALAVPVFIYAGHPLPVTPLAIAANFTILLAHFKIANNLLYISVGWAVVVELFFYILFAMTWLVSRGNAAIVAGTGILFLLFYLAITATDEYSRSFSFLRHAPYFVLGVSYYWALLRRRPANYALTGVSLILTLHSYYVYNAANSQEETLVSSLLFVTSLAIFASLAFAQTSDALKKVDRRLGDYTYAMYLVHWVVIEFVATLAIPDGMRFLLVVAGAGVLAVAINVAVERPLVRLRSLVRGRALYGS
jgi:peptidoglycan/LPS O-acetylase OafA/YrhL